MALVDVERRRRQAHGVQRPESADPEQQLLADTRLAVAAVEPGGDVALVRRVVRDVRVQQQQRDRADHQAPDDSSDPTGREIDGDRDRCPVGVPHKLGPQIGAGALGVALVLSVRVDALLEVAVVVEEPDADERHAEIGCRLEVVAREDPQPAGIDRDVGGEPELGTEVRDEHAVVRREGVGEPGLVSHGTGR